MLENEGHWLKLMRNAIVPTDANICLRISGGEILCTVTKDINKEVELKVTCRIGDQPNKKEIVREEKSTLNNHLFDLYEDKNSKESEASSDRMLSFPMDEKANMRVKMSSNDCDRKNQDTCSDKIDEESNCDIEKRSSTRESSIKGDYKDKVVKPGNSTDTVNSGERKIILTTENDKKCSIEKNSIINCPLCPFYSTDRKIIENHLQSHKSSSLKRGTSHMTNAQSFCEACSIQFMSVDTYQVHKKYYCKSRHDKEEAPSSPSEIEHLPVAIAGAFKPSADTVILRSGAINGAAAPSLIQPQAIYAAISTNPLILLPCSLISGEGLVAQNGVLTTGGPGIVLQTGVACPTIVEKPTSSIKVKEDTPLSRKTSHPIMNFNTELVEKTSSASNSLRKRKMSEGDVLNLKKPFITEQEQIDLKELKSITNDQDSPLDLSLKRKTCSISFSRTVFKRRNSSSVGLESSSPTPSTESSSSPRLTILPTTAAATSPSSSYSNDSFHCYSSHGSVPLLKEPKSHTERVSLSPTAPQSDASNDKTVLPPGMPPPKLHKQGNNVCEECNIVFYKYDNYLAHKKHYCAFRRQQLSALAAAAAAVATSSSINNQEHSSDDNNSNQSCMNDSSQGLPADDCNKSVLRRNEPGDSFRPVVSKPSHSTFVCDACGVKYTSLGTLNAHQTYYCSKRADSAMSKYVKSRSESNGSPSAIEPPFSGPEEWKCNYCEATCSSYETIKRHLLTHNELRGFRCLLCGYKGNTLRGMRTHACEHLNENTTSIEEFVSSTVISENDALPFCHKTVEYSDEESNHSIDKISRKQSRPSSENHKNQTLKYEEHVIDIRLDSKEMSSSTKDISYRDNNSAGISSIKRENHDSSPEASGGSHQESVNPLAFCDVVIKTENDHSSSGDELLVDKVKNSVKTEPQPDSESDSDGRELMLSESPPVQPISVIRRTSDKDRCSDSFQGTQSSKKRSGTQSKTEMKYCKACDISFYHMSNYIAHKEFYCSRPVSNCHQETTPVQ